MNNNVKNANRLMIYQVIQKLSEIGLVNYVLNMTLSIQKRGI